MNCQANEILSAGRLPADVKHKIGAVLFDFGETLVGFGQVKMGHLFQQGAKLSYDFLKSLGQPTGGFFYYKWRSLISLRLHIWLSNITGRDFNSLELLKKAGIKKGIKLTAEQWRYLSWLWYEPLSKIAKAEPGIKETLTKLKQMGLKLAVVSNTFIDSSTLDKHIQHLGILDFFSFRLYSNQFGFRKPDRRIFEIAAERIGEAPENIMFVGDYIDKDIKPALKAGMLAVLKDAYTNAIKKMPEGVYKINQLSELPGLIEKIKFFGLASQ